MISPELESKLRERATAEGTPVDVYLERLLRDEDAEIAHTEALLQAAADSGDPIELTEEEWEHIEQETFAERKSTESVVGPPTMAAGRFSNRP